MAAQVVALGRVVRVWRPDVVNCHWLIPQGLSAALLKRLFGFQIVLHVHAADVYFLRRFAWGSRLAAYVVGRSDLIYADGSHVRDSLDHLIGRSSGARLRPMGVSVSAFAAGGGVSHQPMPAAGRITFVGRLVEKKGLVYLIRALALVRKEIADAHLVVIGSGPLESKLKAEAASQGVSDHVLFLGPLDHAGVVVELHKADLACVPSIIDSMGETEGMPTVVLEAMASGTKVVGSDVNGIPDVLRDRVNGWLAKPADPNALASVIVEALSSPDGERIVQEGLDTALGHDWETVGASYLTPLKVDADHDK
jgi:glycosyltransferase involved in cell wall biosynthesis